MREPQGRPALAVPQAPLLSPAVGFLLIPASKFRFDAFSFSGDAPGPRLAEALSSGPYVTRLTSVVFPWTIH